MYKAKLIGQLSPPVKSSHILFEIWMIKDDWNLLRSSSRDRSFPKCVRPPYTKLSIDYIHIRSTTNELIKQMIKKESIHSEEGLFERILISSFKERVKKLWQWFWSEFLSIFLWRFKRKTFKYIINYVEVRILWYSVLFSWCLSSPIFPRFIRGDKLIRCKHLFSNS